MKKQQLEIRNRQLALQKEKQLFALEKANIEGKLMLKRERYRMTEECKKLKEELHSYQANEHQLDTEGFGPPHT